MKLHSRIYLHSLAVLLVVVVAVTLVFALRGPGAFGRDATERVARHTAALAGEQIADPAALGRRVAQIHADLGIDIAVHGPDGLVLAAAGAPMRTPTPDEVARARAGGVVVRPHPAHEVVATVRDRSGNVAGTITASIHGRLRPPSLVGPLALVALVLLVVAAATRPLARRLARPLERLTGAARRLSAGDLGARARDDRRRGGSSDEIHELTHAFDEMADRVERLVRGQRELLANVSHELRSPLARMRVALELLPRTPDVDARLADIERDLADLDRLIDDVLATARLDATGLPATLAEVDARALLTSLADRAAHDPATAGRDVRVAGGPPVAVLADERLLRRALWNLVENAAKHGAAPIVLSAATEGDRVTLTVTDHGPGIPAAARASVLEPFYRLDRARTPGTTTSGFGLGLAFVRRVVEAHGGTITIDAASTGAGERGCRVTLALPQHQ